MAKNYADLFMRTVPGQADDDAGATVAVYRAALGDVTATFEATGTTDVFPRLMRDLAQRGVTEGYAAKELTSLWRCWRRISGRPRSAPLLPTGAEPLDRASVG